MSQWDRINSNLSAKKQLQAVTVAVGTMTITKTPVLDGYLKASWNFATGAPDDTLQNKSRNSIRALNGGIHNFNVGEIGYFVNGQPYANRIEYTGHSQGAPQGMMRISIANWQEINDDIARRNR